MATPKIEEHNLHGRSSRGHEVYVLPPKSQPVSGGGEIPDYWAAVTDVPCPVKDCGQTVLWYEAGYVPGYRVCMAPLGDGKYDLDTIRHHFLARGKAASPKLVRDDCCEA